MIPHPTANPSPAVISSQTLDLIKKIRKQGKQSESASPVPHLLKEQSKLNSEQTVDAQPDSIIENSDLRLKYSELLKVKRELVLPLHMKQLMEISRFVDESMNFIKRCRKANDGAKVHFSELKTSIEKTFARSVTQG